MSDHRVGSSLSCCGIKEYYGLNIMDWTIEDMFEELIRYRASMGNGTSMRSGILVMTHMQPLQYKRGLSREAQIAAWGENSLAFQMRNYFSPTGKSRRIAEVKKYIKKHNLGRFVAVPKYINPNTSRYLHTGIWVYDPATLHVFLNKWRSMQRANDNAVAFTAPRL